MKKILFAIFMVPVILILAYWIVNFSSGLLSGEINFVTWVMEHKILLTFIVCYGILSVVGPFKKD